VAATGNLGERRGEVAGAACAALHSTPPSIFQQQLRSRVSRRPRSQGQPEFNRKMLQTRIFHISPLLNFSALVFCAKKIIVRVANVRISSQSAWEIEHDLLLRWTNCVGRQSDAPWALDRNCANGFRHMQQLSASRVDRCISTIYYVLEPRTNDARSADLGALGKRVNPNQCGRPAPK
jgi:hypothetical protein